MKKYLSENPTLSSEWHPTKNEDLKPENVTYGSAKKVWWKCPAGDDHEWKTSINSRSGGSGCPFCSGRRASKINNLLAVNPKLASEWHPTKNGDSRPENFTPGSDEKVWWQCPAGDDHEWESIIGNRSRGIGCPFCAGQKADKSNNLLAVNPKLASEWHPTKNKDLKPEDFTPGSSAKKVWWQCPKDEDHEWESIIHDRSVGHGCPFCSGSRASKTNNLLAVNPKLASEWHPTKNGDLKPEDFTLGSNKKVWWQCPAGDDHEWQTRIIHRNSEHNCPFCSGSRASKTNNLLVLNPKLASEWHPTKNKDLKPEDFTPMSGKKFWWICPRGDDHVWQSTIANRSTGRGCPFCSGSGTSVPEIRIFSELKYLFGSEEVVWRSRIDGVEIDIFISKYNIGIEYDGSHWHKEKLQSDIEKNALFQKKGIQILRVREHPLEAISKNDIVVSAQSLNKDNLNTLILEIKAILKSPLKINFDAYISNSSFLNEGEFNRIISFLPSPPTEFSIIGTHPEISKQWHYEKNSPLKPEYFTPGSNKRVWWQCPKVDDHEWEAIIGNRTKVKGTGCPFCYGHKKSK